jgi:hypothetical protein
MQGEASGYDVIIDTNFTGCSFQSLKNAALNGTA